MPKRKREEEKKIESKPKNGNRETNITLAENNDKKVDKFKLFLSKNNLTLLFKFLFSYKFWLIIGAVAYLVDILFIGVNNLLEPYLFSGIDLVNISRFWSNMRAMFPNNVFSLGIIIVVIEIGKKFLCNFQNKNKEFFNRISIDEANDSEFLKEIITPKAQLLLLTVVILTYMPSLTIRLKDLIIAISDRQISPNNATIINRSNLFAWSFISMILHIPYRFTVFFFLYLAFNIGWYYIDAVNFAKKKNPKILPFENDKTGGYKTISNYLLTISITIAVICVLKMGYSLLSLYYIGSDFFAERVASFATFLETSPNYLVYILVPIESFIVIYYLPQQAYRDFLVSYKSVELKKLQVIRKDLIDKIIAKTQPFPYENEKKQIEFLDSRIDDIEGIKIWAFEWSKLWALITATLVPAIAAIINFIITI